MACVFLFQMLSLFALIRCPTVEELIERVAREEWRDTALKEKDVVPAKEIKQAMRFFLSHPPIAQLFLDQNLTEYFVATLRLHNKNDTSTPFWIKVCEGIGFMLMVKKLEGAGEYFFIHDDAYCQPTNNIDYFFEMIYPQADDREKFVTIFKEKGFVPMSYLLVDYDYKLVIKEQLNTGETLNDHRYCIILYKKK